jgi:predicted nucleic acid-binding protein
MKNIIIDTCVLIHIIRETITGKKCIEEISKVDNEPNIIISVVTKAEIESFVLQNNWGKILLDEYSKIDAYSKRKANDKSGNTLKGSAKKMGKNDLWIASTTSALDIQLITTDGDFDHLNGTFIKLIKVV